jgi:hypothetical protein
MFLLGTSLPAPFPAGLAADAGLLTAADDFERGARHRWDFPAVHGPGSMSSAIETL